MKDKNINWVVESAIGLVFLIYLFIYGLTLCVAIQFFLAYFLGLKDASEKPSALHDKILRDSLDNEGEPQ